MSNIAGKPLQGPLHPSHFAPLKAEGPAQAGIGPHAPTKKSTTNPSQTQNSASSVSNIPYLRSSAPTAAWYDAAARRARAVMPGSLSSTDATGPSCCAMTTKKTHRGGIGERLEMEEGEGNAEGGED